MAMSCQELCWKSLSAELLKWLHQLVEDEHTETCLVEDFLKRGALPLLFFAKKAKSEIQNAKVSKTKGTNGENSEPKKLATGENSAADAVSALLCIRLLAQQLQSMAQSTLVQQINEREREADCSHSVSLPNTSPPSTTRTRMTPETEDLALALAHWVSTEWCSPRIEVLDYLPCCCDSFLLSKDCDHLKLKTVLDIVLCAPMPDGQEIGRQRLLHHGPWRNFCPVPGGWHTSYPAGSALHRWEEVTAAGLLLLAAARAWKKGTERVKAQDTETQSRDGRNVRRDRPALLVYGACDGLLASFLAQHAPQVEVDLLEPDDDEATSGATLSLLEKHFDLRLGGQGLIEGSRRVLADTAICEFEEPEAKATKARQLYDGIVLMKPFGSDKKEKVHAENAENGTSEDRNPSNPSKLLRVRELLREDGLLLVESTPEGREALQQLGDLVELNDLLQDDPSELVAEADLDAEAEPDPSVLCIVTPRTYHLGQATNGLDYQELIRPEKWFELLLERGGVRGGAPDVLDAQQTRVVSAGKVDAEDVATLKRLACRASCCGREVRSRNSDTWQVTFLQTDNFFAENAPDLLARFTDIAKSIALEEKWLTPARAERLQARVIEWHQQDAPGPGIPDPRHYDMDSLITVDVMCSEPGQDFLGGQLQTLEVDGLKEHSFKLFDVLVFQAHKYHCVAPVVKGCRCALVLEFWDGPQRVCPHRCTSFERFCPLRPSEPPTLPKNKALGRLLPFRLAAKRETLSEGRRSLSILWQCNEPTQ